LRRRSPTEQASKKSTHADLHRADDLGQHIEEASCGAILRASAQLSSPMPAGMIVPQFCADRMHLDHAPEAAEMELPRKIAVGPEDKRAPSLTPFHRGV
jgi:hypothetical protein